MKPALMFTIACFWLDSFSGRNVGPDTVKQLAGGEQL